MQPTVSRPKENKHEIMVLLMLIDQPAHIILLKFHLIS